MSREHDKDFYEYTSDLIGEQVQVITVEGSYYGELKKMKSDFLLLLTSNRGQSSIIAIRLKKIIGISKNLERKRPLFFGPQLWGEEQEVRIEDQHDDVQLDDDHEFHQDK